MKLLQKLWQILQKEFLDSQQALAATKSQQEEEILRSATHQSVLQQGVWSSHPDHVQRRIPRVRITPIGSHLLK